jgi:hypothetical protein
MLHSTTALRNVEIPRYHPYGTCSSSNKMLPISSPLPFITAITKHNSEKKGRSRKDPRPQLRYRVLIKTSRTAQESSMRLTEEEMRFLGNRKEMLEGYWRNHSISTSFLQSLLVARGPEANKGAWQQLPGSQGDILEWLEANQLVHRWTPGMKWIDAALLKARNDKNPESLKHSRAPPNDRPAQSNFAPLPPFVQELQHNLPFI